MESKRLTLFAGHYGSGKTNVALNFAYRLKETGHDTVIADIDTVNPYFRTKDSAKELEAAGIELIAPEFAGSNVDLPALPAAMYDIIFESEKYAVIDIGGDDRGAFALGRYTPEILRENNYNMLMVINMYRPLTSTPTDTVEILKEIEAASGIPFTGLVNNSNLGIATTAETLEASLSYAQVVSKLSGLPIVATSCPDTAEFENITTFGNENGELIKLKLQNKIVYSIRRKQMAKLTFNIEKCKGCGLCVSACPKHLLIVSKSKINQKGHYVAEITDMESCIGCAFCATMCPDCIIKVEK